MEFSLKGLIKSSVRGQKGNREFFTLWSLREELLDQGKVQKMIKEAVWNEKN
jgi:23S rRNA (cytidine1920-2'-O)/16S rRNA (cytidine1409-2'-O)-methyltransferase